MDNKFFVHQIKRTEGSYDKGIVVKDSLEAAKQTYHAYLGAYAYGRDEKTDYVFCEITNITGGRLMEEFWTNSNEAK